MAFNIFRGRVTSSDRKLVAAFEQQLQSNRLVGVRRFARGNIALQLGRVLTQDRLERERESLRSRLAQAD